MVLRYFLIPQGDVRLMLPPDIGSAAAYEVWRNWKSHYGVYAQPLAGDSDRQREALVGLAVGEGVYTRVSHPFFLPPSLSPSEDQRCESESIHAADQL